MKKKNSFDYFVLPNGGWWDVLPEMTVVVIMAAMHIKGII